MQYLTIAVKNNPTVLQGYYEYQAALQRVPQVGGLPDPQLSVGVFLVPMELMEGRQLADIRLMQMFPWFGVLKSAKDEMSLMARAKFESFRNAKLQVYFDVQKSWYELHKVKQNIRISQKNLEILKTLERLAIVKFKAGPSGSSPGAAPRIAPAGNSQNTPTGSSGMQTMGGGAGNTAGSPPSQGSQPMQGAPMASPAGSSGLADVYRIQIEIGDLQNNIDLLKNQWSTLAAQFNSYLNRPPSTTVTLPDTLIPDSFQPGLMTGTDSILAKNPMLGMLDYEQQSIEARKLMVKRMGYPMIGIGVNYSLIKKAENNNSSMNGKDMIMPMVIATLPIYRKKYNAMQAEADFSKSATAQNLLATANSLQTEYYQAMQLYKDARRRIKLYADQYQLASNSEDIMLKSFASSGAGLTDVLRIRQQALDYEYKQMEAVADYNTSIAWLKKLIAFSE